MDRRFINPSGIDHVPHRMVTCQRCGTYCQTCVEARCNMCPDDGVTAVLDYRHGKCPHFTLTMDGRTRKVRLARAATIAGPRRVYFTRAAEKALDDLEQLDLIVRELRDDARERALHTLACGINLPGGECTCHLSREVH